MDTKVVWNSELQLVFWQSVWLHYTWTRSMKDIATSVDLPSFHAHSIWIPWKPDFVPFSSLNIKMIWNSSFDNPSGYVAREQDRWKISPSSSLSRSILFRFCFNFSSNQHRVVYRALEFRTATRPLVTLHADKIDERYRHFCRSSLLSRQLAFDFVKSFVPLLLQFSSNRRTRE